MHILFCHENFPGRFGPLAAIFAQDPANEVLFASPFQRAGAILPKVRRVIMRMEKKRAEDSYCKTWREGLIRAGSKENFFRRLNEEFKPELVLYSGMRGVTFFIPQIFDRAATVFYAGLHSLESSPNAEQLARLAMQEQRIIKSNLTYMFYDWQLKLFPQILRPLIKIIPVWIDSDWFKNPILDINTNSIFIDCSYSTPNTLPKIAEFIYSLLDSDFDIKLLTAEHTHLFIRWRSALKPELAQRLHLANYLNGPELRNLLKDSSIFIALNARRGVNAGWPEAMAYGTLTLLPEEGLPSFLLPDHSCLTFKGVFPDLQKIHTLIGHYKDYEFIRQNGRNKIAEHWGAAHLCREHIREILSRME